MNSPHKGQWRGALDVFFDLCLDKRLSKQSWGWWLETPRRSLWRHCNAIWTWYEMGSWIFDNSDKLEEIKKPGKLTRVSKLKFKIGTKILEKKLFCIGRESNPGRPRGRRAFYHWTTDAHTDWNIILYISRNCEQTSMIQSQRLNRWTVLHYLPVKSANTCRPIMNWWKDWQFQLCIPSPNCIRECCWRTCNVAQWKYDWPRCSSICHLDRPWISWIL